MTVRRSKNIKTTSALERIERIHESLTKILCEHAISSEARGFGVNLPLFCKIPLASCSRCPRPLQHLASFEVIS